MSWLPWLLLLALIGAVAWCFAEIGRHVRWARRALLAEGAAARPEGWLVRRLRLEELFVAIERRAADEGEIRAAAARRIEALLAPLTDAVLVVDAQDRLRLANPAAAALFGLTDADTSGSIVPLVRSADFIELVRRVRAEGGARSTILLNRAPLSDVWIQAAGARTDPEAFGEEAAIFVLADVTALKRLQAMERDFVTNVSHDLRTPVTILRGSAETLAEDQATMSPEDRARFTQKIVGSVGRLQGLVEGLLALASLESAQDVRREPGALHVAAREVAEEFAARCKAAGVRIELELEAAKGGAADPVQARRLVQNLIDNALAHAAGMSRLKIATRDTLNGVELSVQDDGAGVPPADLPRLFDRFYRTDKSRRAGGSGLGLSIVRQVAELHGGSATADPVQPKGLRITVTLPAAD
jgi:two-component system phosphate regulon sensor histidine kinase PhoR